MDSIESTENHDEIVKTQRKASPTQVLIVLSNNGVEEIPFEDADQQPDQQEETIIESRPLGTTCENRHLNRLRNRSLPANFGKPAESRNQSYTMDYLQVPTKLSTLSFTDSSKGISRHASASSLGSKSSLSSFGIYSAPESPMTPNSPTPSDTGLYSTEVKRKFTFPQADGAMPTHRLTNHMSRSADVISTDKPHLESRLSLEWPQGHNQRQSKQRDEPMKRKKSLLERLGSSMSEKSLISRRLRRSLTNWSSGQSSRDQSTDIGIGFPKTKRSKAKQRFRIVAAKTGQPDGISFECIDKVGFFLRAKGKALTPEREGSDSYFNKDSTFVPLPDMWFPGFFAFESVSKPSYFVRLSQTEELLLDRYDGTSTFKEDASFMLKKRPCATCLQVGVKGWAKLPSGGYCLGKVIAVNDLIEVTVDEGRVMKYERNVHGCLIPDVVPQPGELSIGARVISQWFDREYLYPGIITGVKSNEYEVQFDDGDKGRCTSYQIRLVRDHMFQEHSCNSPSHNSVKKQVSQEQVPENDENKDERLLSCIKRQQFSESRQGRLWSRDGMEGPSHTSREELCKQDSSSSTDTQNTSRIQTEVMRLRGDRRTTVQNLKVSSLETETMSQDSGYHGCLRQKSLEKSQKRLLAALPKWNTQEEEETV